MVLILLVLFTTSTAIYLYTLDLNITSYDTYVTYSRYFNINKEIMESKKKKRDKSKKIYRYIQWLLIFESIFIFILLTVGNM